MTEITETPAAKPQALKLNGLAEFHRKKKEAALLEQQKEIAAFQFIEDPKPAAEEIRINIDPAKTYVFETCIKTKSLRNESLGARCKIFHVPTGRIREIRYIPITKSIFVDEQEESLKDYPIRGLYFTRNRMAVAGSDTRLMEFMLANDNYDGNPHRLSRAPATFTIVDDELFERKEAKRHDLIEEALVLLQSADKEDLRSIAKVKFNIPVDDDLAMMNRLKSVAETNPRAILENVANPKLRRTYNVNQAIEKGVIELQPLKNNAVWGDTKAQICEVQNGKETAKACEEIAVYSFTDEGQEFYSLLTQKLA